MGRSYFSSTTSHITPMRTMYLGYPMSDDLLQRVHSLIKALRETENRRPYAMQLFEIINDLSDEGFDYFFIRSLTEVGVGKVKLMAVNNAIKVGKKPVMSVVKRMVKNFDDRQMLIAADLLEGGLTVHPDDVA